MSDTSEFYCAPAGEDSEGFSDGRLAMILQRECRQCGHHSRFCDVRGNEKEVIRDVSTKPQIKFDLKPIKIAVKSIKAIEETDEVGAETPDRLETRKSDLRTFPESTC